MNDNSIYQYGKNIFYVVFAVLFLIFTARLIQLQFLFQEEYGLISKGNSIRTVSIMPIRGYIYDRNGILIVDNWPSYSITVTPAEFDIKKIGLLSSILSLDKQEILDRIARGKKYNRFAPTRVKRDVDFQTLSLVEEYSERLPGVDYQIESKRYYPTKAKAAHLFGYTKEISDRQLGEMGTYYKQGDIIGASGIEAGYEKFLRGNKGYQLITVDAKGKIVGHFNDGKSDIPPIEGNELELTIDVGVQALAESLLADKRGAVVAINPTDGGIIALVSKPDFDLDWFSGVTPPEIWKQLNTDEARPLYNRATLTSYPPGSTFKMLLAAAALDKGVINENWRINCTGSFKFGNKVFKDLHVHGSTNVVEAIQRSCNVFFYQLMLKTGLETWTYYGREFGFGSPTGIDIMEENSGLLPSVEYYDHRYGKNRWTQGYLVSLGIGQGEVGVSPLQLAGYAMALANEGKYYKPRVVGSIKDKKNGTVQKLTSEMRELKLSKSTWQLIREGLYRAVNVPGGTGAAAKVPGIAVAGKTGTAQNPHGKDHAWFIGFAPYENPKIAICVLVENSGYGGVFAAPIAGQCIEKYIYGEIIRNKISQQPIITEVRDIKD
ncbi:MAG: penicillin-binding protein 2 [Bacteroidetes bacterium]|nr:penicillin-binding protein 2 [Bacteroidota bacterium]